MALSLNTSLFGVAQEEGMRKKFLINVCGTFVLSLAVGQTAAPALHAAESAQPKRASASIAQDDDNAPAKLVKDLRDGRIADAISDAIDVKKKADDAAKDVKDGNAVDLTSGPMAKAKDLIRDLKDGKFAEAIDKAVPILSKFGEVIGPKLFPKTIDNVSTFWADVLEKNGLNPYDPNSYGGNRDKQNAVKRELNIIDGFLDNGFKGAAKAGVPAIVELGDMIQKDVPALKQQNDKVGDFWADYLDKHGMNPWNPNSFGGDAAVQDAAKRINDRMERFLTDEYSGRTNTGTSAEPVQEPSQDPGVVNSNAVSGNDSKDADPSEAVQTDEPSVAASDVVPREEPNVASGDAVQTEEPSGDPIDAAQTEEANVDSSDGVTTEEPSDDATDSSSDFGDVSDTTPPIEPTIAPDSRNTSPPRDNGAEPPQRFSPLDPSLHVPRNARVRSGSYPEGQRLNIINPGYQDSPASSTSLPGRSGDPHGSVDGYIAPTSGFGSDNSKPVATPIQGYNENAKPRNPVSPGSKAPSVIVSIDDNLPDALKGLGPKAKAPSTTVPKGSPLPTRLPGAPKSAPNLGQIMAGSGVPAARNPSPVGHAYNLPADVQRVGSPSSRVVAPKGVLMRLGIDPSTLQKGDVPQALLDRLHEGS